MQQLGEVAEYAVDRLRISLGEEPPKINSVYGAVLSKFASCHYVSSNKNEVLEGHLLEVVITSSCRRQIAMGKKTLNL